MNINTNTYHEVLTDDPEDEPTVANSLKSDLDEHHMIIGRVIPESLTGEVALIPDPESAGTGAMQVWSKTEESTWVHVTPAGEVVYAACPFGD